MMFFTDRDLDCVASLRANWARLYRRELLRLLKQDGSAGDLSPRHPIPILAISHEQQSSYERRDRNVMRLVRI
jgi:hypothetical protein